MNPDTRFGSYQIVSQLGAGGMGEVYRARDTKLNRDVAIKVLPDSFAGDPERRARFHREAQALAALNHPNIAHIHGLEESASLEAGHPSVCAIVMELVEGPTLATRIARGPIPLDEALPIARQIAEALETAHEHGVLHRDLKPANIKVRDDGVVKVLDFGLAKLAASETSGARDIGAPELPTLTSPAGATMAGIILGTAAYMAPEQARGKPVDRRADIWAFGVVLFEMLTGRRLFPGEEVSDVLASVLKTEADWTALPGETPASIRRLLTRCLKKDPKERLQAIGDARIEIADELGGRSDASVTSGRAAPTRRIGVVPWATAAVLVVALSVLSIIHFGERPAPTAEMRLDITTPATTDFISFALSPDGRSLAFVATEAGVPRLWVRSFASTTPQLLPGTEGATMPFWSPDARSIAFFADGKLKRADLSGGAPRIIVARAAARGGAWGADDVILFATGSQSPLFRVPATGGDPIEVTKLDKQSSHRWPRFLPDGRQFLYFAQGPAATGGIFLSALDSNQTTRLTPSDTAGVLVAPDWLVWGRSSTLVAQRLDVQRRSLTGDFVTIADSIAVDSALSASAVSASTTGVIAYRASAGAERQLQWFDRSGKPIGSLGRSEDVLLAPRISVDGRRTTGMRNSQGNVDIWMIDGARMSRLTFDTGIDRFPVWSPDGSRLVFDSNRSGRRHLYVMSVNRPGSETILLESPEDKVASSWSQDGRWLFYHVFDPQTDVDVWVLSMTGESRTPWPFLKTNFAERAPQISPNGQWVAYQSNESGRHEVYVRSFDPSAASKPANSGAQWAISNGGGIHPRWSADGRELFYISPNGQVMSVAITTSLTTLEPGVPKSLFMTRIYGGGMENSIGRQYDVTADGRFLINTVVGDVSTPITVLMNWKPTGK